MVDIFHQEAFAEIEKETSKLRTYGKIKIKTGQEKYLVSMPNINHRTAISIIRLSNHELMIEKGRHLKIGKDERFCPFCPELVETEKHFILFCKTFSHMRKSLFSEVNILIPGFDGYDETTQFKVLLCDENVLPVTGKFLYESMDIRKFLTKKPKNAA